MHLIKGHEIRHHRQMASYYDLDLEEITLVAGIWSCKNVEGILNVGTEIGQWKIENKTVQLPCDVYKFKYTEAIEIPEMKNETLQIEDEWDTHSICKQILDKGAMMIRAVFAGSGKSYIGEYFSKMNKRVLFVVPTNRLQEKEVEAVTCNKFFLISVEVDEKLPPFDHSCYDVIVFNEIFMVNMNILNIIRLFCLKNTDKIRVGTGDTKQLQSIEHVGNQDKETYMNHCVDLIFKRNIFLKICKRVGGKDTEEGDRNRKIIDDMYNDFWLHKLDIKDILPEHWKTTSDIMASDHNIAYTNIRCRTQSSEIRERLGKGNKYEVGEILIARKWVNIPRININLRYKLSR